MGVSEWLEQEFDQAAKEADRSGGRYAGHEPKAKRASAEYQGDGLTDRAILNPCCAK